MELLTSKHLWWWLGVFAPICLVGRLEAAGPAAVQTEEMDPSVLDKERLTLPQIESLAAVGAWNWPASPQELSVVGTEELRGLTEFAQHLAYWCKAPVNQARPSAQLVANLLPGGFDLVLPPARAFDQLMQRVAAPDAIQLAATPDPFVVLYE